MTRVFRENPRRRELTLTDDELVALCMRSTASFEALPALHLGESLHVRRTSVPGVAIQRMVPSLNSITFERKGEVVGTDRLRLDVSELFWSAAHRERIATCHLARHGDHVLITEERAVPVEVIVKAAWVGTPTRVYHGLSGRTDRFGERFVERARHAPYVRFDYRNPLRGPNGEALRDECMPEALADRLIDTRAAADHALRIFALVRDRLVPLGLDVLDACFLFDESGRVLCYELSPDNMRVKDVGWFDDPSAAREFDKDLWRRGSDPASLHAQWSSLLERLRAREPADAR